MEMMDHLIAEKFFISEEKKFGRIDIREIVRGNGLSVFLRTILSWMTSLIPTVIHTQSVIILLLQFFVLKKKNLLIWCCCCCCCEVGRCIFVVAVVVHVVYAIDLEFINVVVESEDINIIKYFYYCSCWKLSWKHKYFGNKYMFK